MGNYYYYEYGNDVAVAESAFAEAFMAVYGIVGILSMVFSIVAYVFQALGLYTIAKRRGFRSPWTAWVPLANIWLMGAIADDFCFKTEGVKTKYRKRMVGTYISVLILTFIISMYIVMTVEGYVRYTVEEVNVAISLYVHIIIAIIVLMIIYVIFTYIALYKIYKSCQPTRAVLYLLLSLFVGVVQPFFVFAVRNSDEGIPPEEFEQEIFFQTDDYIDDNETDEDYDEEDIE